MTPALETLLLAFRMEGGPPVPGRALLLGAAPHPEFRGWPGIVGWQPLKPEATVWGQAGLPRVDDPAGSYPLVMVLPGKSRDETLAWFALAREHLEPGGRLLVAMTNATGAGRFEKELARACGRVESIQKHKCRAFHAVDDGTWNEDVFAEWRMLGARREVPGTRLVAAAGMFSVDHVDPGSALLAAGLPGGMRGRVADLGAGWGYLTDAVLKRSTGVKRMDLYEADARALECARANLAGWQRELSFHWWDVSKGLRETYDAIVMNPPFHRGRETAVDLGVAFIHAAAAALRRGGSLYLVANRQLPYESVLESCGLSWHQAGGDPSYKLLFARKR
ncbi:MAG: methyltransferase [Akkermansiaceae bacterium]|nr:methyltransferase [Akkermansiaceae bacterium]